MDSFLLCGLGNIGEKYARTRHNVGFLIVDHLVKHLGTSWTTERLAMCANTKIKGHKLYLIKPTTLMNLSGRALQYWVTKLNLPLERVLVIVDDLNLPFLKLRYRSSGSSGGHNGLRYIESCLGTKNYPRLRIGIGNNFAKGNQVNFVLDNWDRQEWSSLESSVPIITEKILAYIIYPKNANQLFQL